MRKAVRITGVIVFLAIVSIIGGLWLQGDSSKKSLARYKADMLAKGEKLKISEFVLPPSTNAEHILSRQVFATNTPPELTHNPILMEFVGPGKARVAWRGQLHEEATNDDETIAVGDWNQLGFQKQESGGEMLKYIQALENPPPDTGWVFKDDLQNVMSWPGMRPGLRGVSASLTVDVLLNLHEGRFEAGISSLHSLIAMSQVYRNEPVLITELVRGANANTGLMATWEVMQATNWDEMGLSALQGKWEAVELYDGMERAFLFERALANLMMQKFRNAKSREYFEMFATTTSNADGTVAQVRLSAGGFWHFRVVPFFYKLGGMDKDELHNLEHWKGLLDGVRLAKSNRPLFEIKNLEAVLKTRYEDWFGGASGFRRLVLSYGTPNLTGRTPRVIQTETFRRLTITAIALKRHQLKNGSFPQSLNALVPEFVSAVPIDPMSGKPFCYRLNADGTFVLYSTGEDGKDDGGDATPREKNGKFGLWEGRDAVWPVAATIEEQAAADHVAKKK